MATKHVPTWLPSLDEFPANVPPQCSRSGGLVVAAFGGTAGTPAVGQRHHVLGQDGSTLCEGIQQD